MTKTEQWVGKARAKRDEPREYLRHYYSDGERLIATNGHRLHIAPTELAAGYYDRLLLPVEDLGKYPQIDRILNTMSDGTYIAHLPDLEIMEIGAAPSDCAYLLPCNRYVDKKYWDDATEGETLITYTAHHQSAHIHFEDGRIAVVMEVRNV